MTLNRIETLKTSIYNKKHINKHENTFSTIQFILKNIFCQKYKFIKISVFRRCSWPAFGGPKILVYIYIYVFVYFYIIIYIYTVFV